MTPPRAAGSQCMRGLIRRSLFSIPAAAGAAAVALAASCSAPKRGEPDKVRIGDAMQQTADASFVREPFDDQARLAVLRQRALFDHHFEPFSSHLTSLGERDLQILAAAMRRDGGRISLPRGGCSESLHAARVEAVRAALEADGIAADRIELDGGPIGGRGVSTAEAILIRVEIARNPLKIPDASTSSASSATPATPTGVSP